MTGCGKPVMRSQVMDHFLFQPMMQWQEYRRKPDHEQEVFPGLAMRDRIDIFLKDEENEFKEHEECKEADHFDGGG